MEEYLVLRAPPLLASQLRYAIEAQQDEHALQMQLIPKGKPGSLRRKYTLRIGKEKYRAEKIPLPTVIETHRTMDGTSLIKSGNVSGMLVVLPNASEAAHEDEAESQDGMVDEDGEDDDDGNTFDQSIDESVSVAASESKRSAAPGDRASSSASARPPQLLAGGPGGQAPMEADGYGMQMQPPSLPRRAEDLPDVRVVSSGPRDQVLDSGLSPPTRHIVQRRFNRARRAIMGGRSRAEIRAAERLLGTMSRESGIVSIQDDLIEPEAYMQALPSGFQIDFLEGQPYRATRLSDQRLQRLSQLTDGKAGAGVLRAEGASGLGTAEGGSAGTGTAKLPQLSASGAVPLALLRNRSKKSPALGSGPGALHAGAGAGSASAFLQQSSSSSASSSRMGYPEPSPPLLDVPRASPSIDAMRSVAFRSGSGVLGSRGSAQLRPVSTALRQSSFESSKPSDGGSGGTPTSGAIGVQAGSGSGGAGTGAGAGADGRASGGLLGTNAGGAGAGGPATLATRLGSVTFQQYQPGGGGAAYSGSNQQKVPTPTPTPNASSSATQGQSSFSSSIRAGAAQHAMGTEGHGSSQQQTAGPASVEAGSSTGGLERVTGLEPVTNLTGQSIERGQAQGQGQRQHGAGLPQSSPTGSMGLPAPSPNSHGAVSGGPRVSAGASSVVSNVGTPSVAQTTTAPVSAAGSVPAVGSGAAAAAAPVSEEPSPSVPAAAQSSSSSSSAAAASVTVDPAALAAAYRKVRLAEEALRAARARLSQAKNALVRKRSAKAVQQREAEAAAAKKELERLAQG